MTAIRDLSAAEFEQRYGCDRFTATVLTNRFGYVVEHMCARLLTSAFSPILRDFYDFAATITGPPPRAAEGGSGSSPGVAGLAGDVSSDAGWPTPAMSASIVLFTGTMADSVRNTVEEYGIERLEAGDVIVANDPYRNGTHVNDLLFVRPVFHAGELAGFVNMKAHQLDMGGVVPAGFSIAKRNVYENGLVLSPRALYRAGEPVHDTWSLIFDNVRFGEVLAPDMLSIVAELELGERLLTETIERYGTPAVHGAMTYACDAAAERMSAALAAIPDGTWVGEDLIDCDAAGDDEEYRVRVTVTKRGGRAEVDFSGTSRQARTCINATPLDAKTTVGIAFKYLFDPEGWFTSGAMRAIDLVIPEGSVVSALPPEGAVFAYWEQSQVMLSAVLRALAQGVGEAAIAGDRGSADIHSANGLRADGSPWISAAQVGGEIGAYGGNRHGDADSQMLSYQANGIGVAVESVESEVPVVVLRHEPVPDTAGAGYNRGGASMVRDTVWLAPAQHHLMSLRYKRAPGFGVEGGGDGSTGGIWITDEHGEETHVAGLDGGVYRYPYRVPFWETRPGAQLRYVTAGGGGWGNPFDREPERVLRDVRDGYVTIEGAARDYGVAVTGDPERDPEGLAIDVEATARLRSAP